MRRRRRRRASSGVWRRVVWEVYRLLSRQGGGCVPRAPRRAEERHCEASGAAQSVKPYVSRILVRGPGHSASEDVLLQPQCVYYYNTPVTFSGRIDTQPAVLHISRAPLGAVQSRSRLQCLSARLSVVGPFRVNASANGQSWSRQRPRTKERARARGACPLTLAGERRLAPPPRPSRPAGYGLAAAARSSGLPQSGSTRRRAPRRSRRRR